jgi:hypothetical protein
MSLYMSTGKRIATGNDDSSVAMYDIYLLDREFYKCDFVRPNA